MSLVKEPNKEGKVSYKNFLTTVKYIKSEYMKYRTLV